MAGTSKRTYYILAIIAFVVVSYVMSYVSLRLDFSKGKAYTLSDSSKRVIRNLKSPVTITFFSSSALPSRLQPTKREVTDLLAEYKRAGRSNIILNTKDPKKDDAAKKDVTQYGIPELNFSQAEQDQFAVTTGYFGIGVMEKGKRASLPQVTNISDLEYNLTSAIYKLSVNQLPTVGLMGGDSPDQQFNTLHQAADPQFNLQPISSPSSSMKAVMVIDTRAKGFTDEELHQLEQYIRGGGRAIVMADGTWVSPTLTSDKAGHNLFGLFKKFGITLHENLLLSTAAEIVNFGGGQAGFQMLTAYPYWIRTQSFDKMSSYFSNIRQLTFPWTSSLTTSKQNNETITVLVKTTPNSWEQTKDFTLNPSSIRQPTRKDLHTFNLISEAKLKNGGAIMVIPSSRFVEDQFLSQNSDNVEFVLNVMSDYAAHGALAGIRARSVDLYPLPPDLSNQQKDLFKYLTILLLPVLFAGYGMYRLVKRK